MGWKSLVEAESELRYERQKQRITLILNLNTLL